MKQFFFIVLLSFTFQSNAQNPNWMNFFSGKVINNLVGGQNEIWISTESRLVKYDKITGNMSYPTPLQSEECTNYYIMMVDNFNNLWLSSSISPLTGLYKYDGNAWINFNSQNSNLPPYHISQMTVSSDNTLWLVSTYHLIKYDGANFIIYNMPAINSILGNVRGIKCDSNNHVWIGTSIGLFKFTGTGFLYFSSSNSGLIYDDINTLNIDANDNIWMGVSHWDGSNYQWVHGVSKFNGQNFTNYLTGNSNFPQIMDAVNSIDFDTSGNVWFSTISNGLLTYADTTWVEVNTITSGLQTNNLSKIHIDENNVKWIGSRGKGLIKYDNVNFTMINPANSLNIGPVGAIGFDKSWKNFISSSNNYQSAGELTQFINLTWTNVVNAPISNFSVFYRDNNGDLWGTNNNNLYKYNGSIWTTLTYNFYSQATSIIKDLNNNIWVGTHGNFLHKFDGFNWIKYTGSTIPNLGYYIKELSIDQNGNIWMITPNSNGLYMFNGNTWLNIPSGTSTYPLGSLLSMTIDPNNTVWLGVGGKGLVKFDGQTWTNYNTSNSGIPHNSIHSIKIDSYGNKWLGHAYGITKFDGSNFVNYNSANSPIPSSGICLNLEIDNKNNKWFTFDCQLIVMNENGLVLSDNEITSYKSDFIVYPNPTHDNISIKGLNNSNSILVTDALGKKLYFKDNPSEEEILDISGLQKGIYFVISNDKENLRVQKFIKL